jgi:hypothetical protein
VNRDVCAIPALPRDPTCKQTFRIGRFVQQATFLFHHLIGAQAHDIGHIEAERLGRFEVEDNTRNCSAATIDGKRTSELMAERSVLLALHASHHKCSRV